MKVKPTQENIEANIGIPINQPAILESIYEGMKFIYYPVIWGLFQGLARES